MCGFQLRSVPDTARKCRTEIGGATFAGRFTHLGEGERLGSLDTTKSISPRSVGFFGLNRARSIFVGLAVVTGQGASEVKRLRTLLCHSQAPRGLELDSPLKSGRMS